jgi:mRNA interferase MazF
MKQRDIYLVRFDPTEGGEQKGVRPAVIISGNSLNENLPVCIICPLSSRIKNYPGCLVLKKSKGTGLSKDSELITFQIRVISKERLINKIGEISNEDLKKIKIGLMEILTY